MIATKVDIMSDVIGQRKIKNQFNFHLKPYKKNGIFPSTLVNASMGEGKTLILHSLAKELKKKTCVINCASVKNSNVFVTSFYKEYMEMNEPFTIIADEFQVLDKTTQSLLLTLLTPNKNYYNETVHVVNGVPITLKFNMKRNTFLAATTNMETLLQPLLDRFRIVSMEKYRPNELMSILRIGLDDVHIIESVLEDLLNYIRANPRSCIMFASDIQQACVGEGTKIFNKRMWEDLKEVLSLRLYGLNEMEENLLKILKRNPAGIRLTHLANNLRLDNKTIPSIERYLVYHDLMQNLNGLRNLTEKGQEYFKH